jgi:hypothetical protein
VTKRLVVIWIEVLVVAHLALAEDPTKFIAGGAGGYYSSVSGFDKLSSSRFVFAFAGECGFPMSQDLSFYFRITYFAKSGIRASSLRYYDYIFRPLVTPETVVGDVDMRQLMLNYGVSHTFSLTEKLGLDVSLGFAYAKFICEGDIRPGSSHPTPPVATHDGYGGFTGATGAYRLGSSPLSVFVEGQYNYLWPNRGSLLSSYGALNLSGGLRVSLDSRE